MVEKKRGLIMTNVIRESLFYAHMGMKNVELLFFDDDFSFSMLSKIKISHYIAP